MKILNGGCGLVVVTLLKVNNMIVYTPAQLFDLLSQVTCETDLVEIEHYTITNRKAYSWIDNILFTIAINDLHKIL